jgi:hypothetical protein
MQGIALFDASVDIAGARKRSDLFHKSLHKPTSCGTYEHKQKSRDFHAKNHSFNCLLISILLDE